MDAGSTWEAAMARQACTLTPTDPAAFQVECKLELLVMESISMKLTKAFTAHRDRVL